MQPVPRNYADRFLSSQRPVPLHSNPPNSIFKRIRPSPHSTSFLRRQESTAPFAQRKGARVSAAKRAGDARGNTSFPRSRALQRTERPPTLPLSSPTKGARASEASTRGMPGADAGRLPGKTTPHADSHQQAPFAQRKGARVSGAKRAGDARGGWDGTRPKSPQPPFAQSQTLCYHTLLIPRFKPCTHPGATR